MTRKRSTYDKRKLLEHGFEMQHYSSLLKVFWRKGLVVMFRRQEWKLFKKEEPGEWETLQTRSRFVDLYQDMKERGLV